MPKAAKDAKKAQKRPVPATTAQGQAGAPAPAKKTRPERTAQNPFEQTEETTYTVDKMLGMRWCKGNREYLVRWEGYAASHDTWEPMENLVGCAKENRTFELDRIQEDKDASAEVLAKRQKANAAEQALPGTGEGKEAAEFAAETLADGRLKRHARKKGAVWKAYDLTVEAPACKLKKENGSICGNEPSPAAGTTYYWSHLWTHHRTTWYDLNLGEKRQQRSA